MKRISTLFLFLSMGYFSWSQCSFDLLASDTLVCPGDSVNLNAVGPVNSVQTTLAAGNNHRGNMFSITAINDVLITGFDAHPMGNTTIEIYYKTGTYQGFENNSGAWTFVGSAPVVAMPTGTPTPVPVNVNVTIPAGQTYSFYVSSNNTAVSLNYTNGTSVGSIFASDANIQFLEGCGLEYPFSGSPFTPRVWNGVIHYTPITTTSYVWSTGATTNSIDVYPMSSSYYGVEITAAGCATYSDSVWIDVPSIPVNLGADVDLCEGGSVTLDAGILDASYVWNANPVDTLQTYTANATGTYSVVVVDSIGCVSTDDVEVTVHLNPVIDLGEDTVFCVNESLTLDAGSGFASYQWSNSQTSSSIVLNGATLGAGTYTYSVDVTDNFGCMGSDDITVTVDGCASLEELSNLGIEVYPNPSSGIVHVNVPADMTLHVRVLGYDGKLLLEEAMTTSGTLDLSALQAGNYLLEISAENFSEIVRIAKQ